MSNIFFCINNIYSAPIYSSHEYCMSKYILLNLLSRIYFCRTWKCFVVHIYTLIAYIFFLLCTCIFLLHAYFFCWIHIFCCCIWIWVLLNFATKKQPYEITAGHRSLSNTISCVTDRIRFQQYILHKRPARIASDRHEVPTARHDVWHWRNIYFGRCHKLSIFDFRLFYSRSLEKN